MMAAMSPERPITCGILGLGSEKPARAQTGRTPRSTVVEQGAVLAGAVAAGAAAAAAVAVSAARISRGSRMNMEGLQKDEARRLAALRRRQAAPGGSSVLTRIRTRHRARP